jgi:hypothetical protein
MDHNVIRRAAMVIASLNRSGPRLPDLDRAVFGASHHPFSLAVKGDTSDITGMTLEGQ